MSAAPPELLALLVPPGDFDARPVVESLVRLGLAQRASDLHLRPVEERVEVLLRLDGVLSHRFNLPRGVYDRLLVGLKNMARLLSYKKSVPQDGQLLVDGNEVRVATMPTHFGEKAVLRILRTDRRFLAVDELGLMPDELASLQRMLDLPEGLVLATGPAGSGKTTTLFAALRWLYSKRGQLNVVTLEDPIELVVPEFTQTAMQPAMDMTFASGLRSVLRQDPEVILVGEVRDPETARAVVQCSLTGHLVCSTVHARDSVGVIPRLLEMGVEPYLLSASLTGVIYQRLLRLRCRACQSGCEACSGTGYQGRSAVAELLVVNDAVRQAILDRRPLSELRALSGHVTLREAAERRVRAGRVSIDEVQRMIP
ncbi:MAG TPA: GspE/PulE family protein [Candidatus Xenobia bacterium]